MNPLLFITLISSCFLIFISLFLNRKQSIFQYVLPLIISIVSIALIVFGFVVGRWEGMGLSAVGFALLISSIISIIVVSLVSLGKSHH
ncbi:YesK family protein [Gottfriedia acidiceleris]|uniref:YesK family protein n=1 Tax=Gottfriedia acidiceleris TaxID=371036 RepID=UPI003000C52A